VRFLVVLLLCLAIGSPSPPVASFELKACRDTGCIPPFDGMYDLQGPSSWYIEHYIADSSGFLPLPRRARGHHDFEVYFSPSVHAWFPSEGEVPGDVCGPAGSMAACMCAWYEVTLTMRYTCADGSVVEQTQVTPFMGGTETYRVVFSPPPDVRQAQVNIGALMHYWFFGENLQPSASLQYMGCVRRVVRLRTR